MKMKRAIVKFAKHILVAAAALALFYYFPIPIILFTLCGFCDVSRNQGLDAGVLKQYFLKNGFATWLASPINILLDVLSLPFSNKGIYDLSDLPLSYQSEIRNLLRSADESDLPNLLRHRSNESQRSMFFFKWYGRDAEAPVAVPGFQREFKYVRTIGVSIFREHESTSRHFGPFRATIRLLYCLGEIKDENAYIRVGTTENHWNEKRLFIFDDTLLHQSFNETDESRVCLFVDLVRPSYISFVFDGAVWAIRMIFKGMNGIFYKNWKLVNN